MLEEWIRNSTQADGGEGGSNRNKKLILVVAVCIGILALIWPVTKVDQSTQTLSGENSGSSTGSKKATVEKELEAILSGVEGAGSVQVKVTLQSDGKKTYARNTKEEKRSTHENERGGQKQMEENSQTSDIAVLGGNALIIEESAPQILGVLVVAEGAGDPRIQEQLTDITSTLLNISPHHVRVVAAEVGK
ncbi:MAG TPA: hypothetical protein GX404_01815 [Syntrophomonadaceae bacterium]|nr:hypothetical protein [Syntrophomonadaceae bacterium]